MSESGSLNSVWIIFILWLYSWMWKSDIDKTAIILLSDWKLNKPGYILIHFCEQTELLCLSWFNPLNIIHSLLGILLLLFGFGFISYLDHIIENQCLSDGKEFCNFGTISSYKIWNWQRKLLCFILNYTWYWKKLLNY